MYEVGMRVAAQELMAKTEKIPVKESGSELGSDEITCNHIFNIVDWKHNEEVGRICHKCGAKIALEKIMPKEKIPVQQISPPTSSTLKGMELELLERLVKGIEDLVKLKRVELDRG